MVAAAETSTSNAVPPYCKLVGLSVCFKFRMVMLRPLPHGRMDDHTGVDGQSPKFTIFSNINFNRFLFQAFKKRGRTFLFHT
jgi:hypothetical protein